MLQSYSYDTASQATALAAAEVVISLLDLMVGSPVKGNASQTLLAVYLNVLQSPSAPRTHRH